MIQTSLSNSPNTSAGSNSGKNVVVEYIVLTKSTPEGVSAWIPCLPDCWSEGKTDEEALNEMRGAVADHLSGASEIELHKTNSNHHTLSVTFC